jgi:hypothetical protein
VSGHSCFLSSAPSSVPGSGISDAGHSPSDSGPAMSVTVPPTVGLGTPASGRAHPTFLVSPSVRMLSPSIRTLGATRAGAGPGTYLPGTSYSACEPEGISPGRSGLPLSRATFGPARVEKHPVRARRTPVRHRRSIARELSRRRRAERVQGSLPDWLSQPLAIAVRQ